MVITTIDGKLLCDQHGTDGLAQVAGSLARADLRGLQLPYLALPSRDLRGARFGRAEFYMADFSEARLERSRWRQASASWAQWSGAYLQDADMRDLYAPRSTWIRAICPRLRARRAYLHGAIFVGAQLQGADFRDADLRSADLTEARLFGACLRGANLSGADLTGAHFDWGSAAHLAIMLSRWEAPEPYYRHAAVGILRGSPADTWPQACRAVFGADVYAHVVEHLHQWPNCPWLLGLE